MHHHILAPRAAVATAQHPPRAVPAVTSTQPIRGTSNPPRSSSPRARSSSPRGLVAPPRPLPCVAFTPLAGLPPRVASHPSPVVAPAHVVLDLHRCRGRASSLLHAVHPVAWGMPPDQGLLAPSRPDARGPHWLICPAIAFLAGRWASNGPLWQQRGREEGGRGLKAATRGRPPVALRERRGGIR